MIKVVAHNYIKEEKIVDFIAIAKQLVQATRENDLGCIRYELLQDVKNPAHLTMLEEWLDEESLAKHASSKHFKDSISKFGEFIEKSGEPYMFKTID